VIKRIYVHGKVVLKKLHVQPFMLIATNVGKICQDRTTYGAIRIETILTHLQIAVTCLRISTAV